MEEDNTVSSEVLLPSGSVVCVVGGMASCVVLVTGNLHPSHPCSSTAVIVTGSVFLINGQDVRFNTAAASHKRNRVLDGERWRPHRAVKSVE